MRETYGYGYHYDDGDDNDNDDDDDYDDQDDDDDDDNDVDDDDEVDDDDDDDDVDDDDVGDDADDDNDAFELCQHITEPTHVKGNILDVVISKKRLLYFFKSYVNRDLSSDHFCLVSEFDLPVPPPELKSYDKQNIKRIDMDNFKSDFRLFINPSICGTVDKFQNALSGLLDKYAPLSHKGLLPLIGSLVS